MHTETELKDTPVPTASLEVVNPDGTETIVAMYRDGTDSHGFDPASYITIDQSRNGGTSFSNVDTIYNPLVDGSRTGNGLIALDDTTLLFFDSQVDSTLSEATAVHRLDWNESATSWDVTENVNRYEDYRILPHYVENGVVKLGYVDFTVSPQAVRFGEYDPSANSLTTHGVINNEPIRPNEHVLQPRNDGTLVAVVRCEAPDVDTTAPVQQWSTSSDGGNSWTNRGYVQQTLHPSGDSFGATKGSEMIDTPDGERLAYLYRWSQNTSSGSQETLIGIFDPEEGEIERNVIINTVDSNEGSNGSIQLVESNDESWRFYAIHEQGNGGSTAEGSGVFFRDLTVEQLSADHNDVGGRYYLRNVHSGYVADVEAGSTENGADIIQSSWTGNDNQIWDLVQNADGTYRIRSFNSGKVMEVEDGSTAQGANVLQSPWYGGDNQRWNLIQNVHGTYRIENENSGKVLGLTGAAESEGDSLAQYGWGNKDSRKWTIHSI